jgi:hypothetical protein
LTTSRILMGVLATVITVAAAVVVIWSAWSG